MSVCVWVMEYQESLWRFVSALVWDLLKHCC